jgi:hypothetical protein
LKIRIAVAPDRTALAGDELLACADVLAASSFDAIWLSDQPLASTSDPLLGLAAIAGRTARLKLSANVGYTRTELMPDTVAGLRARRPDVDPHSVAPVGTHGLRELTSAYVGAGLSMFVVRPLVEVASWDEEAKWLANTIGDLQT